MAKAADLTIEILKQIRDAVTETNVRIVRLDERLSTRIDETNARLDETNARLDETSTNVAALAHRQTETEVRLSTEIIEVARAVHGVRDLLRERLDDRDRVTDLERRVGALERKTG